ncbi:MAG: hypothetical protein ACI9EW_003981, partial [Cellvibrionaceae bacterium]
EFESWSDKIRTSNSSVRTIAGLFDILIHLSIRPHLQPAIKETLIGADIFKICEPI